MTDGYYAAKDIKRSTVTDGVIIRKCGLPISDCHLSDMSLTMWMEVEVEMSGLPAQESYNEAHQQNAQPLHYLPAGTNILALWGFFSNLSRLHNTPKTSFFLLAESLC